MGLGQHGHAAEWRTRALLARCYACTNSSHGVTEATAGDAPFSFRGCVQRGWLTSARLPGSSDFSRPRLMPRTVVCGSALPFSDDDLVPWCTRDACLRVLWIVLMAVSLARFEASVHPCRCAACCNAACFAAMHAHLDMPAVARCSTVGAIGCVLAVGARHHRLPWGAPLFSCAGMRFGPTPLLRCV